MTPLRFLGHRVISRWLLLGSACAALMLWAPSPLGAGQPVDAIVASVDGEPITMRDLKAFSAAQKITLPGGNDPESVRIKREALKGLIEDKLMELELRSFSDSIDDRAIDRYIAKLVDRNHISEGELRAEVARHGMTWDKYRKQVKLDLEKMEMIEHRVRQKISVTPEQIKAYYDAHTNEFTVNDERFELAQILVAVDSGAPADKRAAARKKAEALRKRALAGEDFGELARKNSADDSASKGGELGSFSPDEILDQIKVAVSKLDSGQISEVVETSHGFHIVKVEQHQRPGVRPLSELREEIRARLEDGALQDHLRRWVDDDLMKSHHVESFL
jgi:peptidyl-prolyl cis-trans isomerase SurA